MSLSSLAWLGRNISCWESNLSRKARSSSISERSLEFWFSSSCAQKTTLVCDVTDNSHKDTFACHTTRWHTDLALQVLYGHTTAFAEFRIINIVQNTVITAVRTCSSVCCFWDSASRRVTSLTCRRRFCSSWKQKPKPTVQISMTTDANKNKTFYFLVFEHHRTKLCQSGINAHIFSLSITSRS